MKHITIRLDEHLLEHIRKVCFETRQTRTKFIQGAIISELMRHADAQATNSQPTE